MGPVVPPLLESLAHAAAPAQTLRLGGIGPARGSWSETTTARRPAAANPQWLSSTWESQMPMSTRPSETGNESGWTYG